MTTNNETSNDRDDKDDHQRKEVHSSPTIRERVQTKRKNKKKTTSPVPHETPTTIRPFTEGMKVPSMLPLVTPELLKEHAAQKGKSNGQQLQPRALSYSRQGSVAAQSDLESGSPVGSESSPPPPPPSCFHIFCPCHHDEQAEPNAICGIPFYLAMILMALVAAVTTGTVLAVIFYDPNDGIQPPSPSPTSFLPTNATADTATGNP